MRIRYLALLIAEHASTRALDAVITLALIRMLDVVSLGTFLVYQSWAAILMLLFPALENMLYREHGRLKASGSLDRELATYRKFNWIKLGFAAALTFSGALLPVKDVAYPKRLAAMALAFALPLSQALYGVFREPLRFEMHQGKVVMVAALQRLLMLVAILTIGSLRHGAIEPITISSLLIYIFFGVVWSALSTKFLLGGKRVRVRLREAWPRIRDSFTEAILWLHLSGAIAGAVQTLDVYFLSRRSWALSEVAVYSVALKAANFFQLLSLPVTQAFGIYLGRRSGRQDPRSEHKAVWAGVLAFAFVGAIAFGFGSSIADPLLAFLARGKFSAAELTRAAIYFRWMLGGVVVLSIGFAPGTYITSRRNVRDLVVRFHIPWMLSSAIVYGVASSRGPLVTATANVVVAGFYSLGLLLFFYGTAKRGQRAKAPGVTENSPAKLP